MDGTSGAFGISRPIRSGFFSSADAAFGNVMNMGRREGLFVDVVLKAHTVHAIRIKGMQC